MAVSVFDLQDGHRALELHGSLGATGKGHDSDKMALHGNGVHHVSLDEVIKTMRETAPTCTRNTRKPRAAALP